jgi:hypothetical protein
MQAVRRTISKTADKQPMRLTDLPGAFESQWGTMFEKSRLGLRDLADLASMLSLFTESFHVDKSNPSGPTVVCLPGNTQILPPDESMALMLFRRSKELQPRKLFECLDTYREGLDKAATNIADMHKQAAAAAAAVAAQDEARKLAEAAREAQAAAAPKSGRGPGPPWRAAVPMPQEMNGMMHGEVPPEMGKGIKRGVWEINPPSSDEASKKGKYGSVGKGFELGKGFGEKGQGLDQGKGGWPQASLQPPGVALAQEAPPVNFAYAGKAGTPFANGSPAIKGTAGWQTAGAAWQGAPAELKAQSPCAGPAAAVGSSTGVAGSANVEEGAYAQ